MTTRLTVKAIEAAKPGKVLTDGALAKGTGKLMLRVRSTKEWYFRYRTGRGSTLIKLGDYAAMSLPEARQRAGELGGLVREGIDPKEKAREDAEEAHRAAEREARRGKPGATARRVRGAAARPREGERQGGREPVRSRSGQALLQPGDQKGGRDRAGGYPGNPRAPPRQGCDPRRE